MKTGRPALYKSVESLEIAINKYFELCPDKRVVSFQGVTSEIPCPTISGLALFLGFCDRHAMYNYEARPEFCATIKKARAKMERVYESLLQGPTPTGAIFALKNFGWVDRTEHQYTGDLNFNFNLKNIVSDAERKYVRAN